MPDNTKKQQKPLYRGFVNEVVRELFYILIISHLYILRILMAKQKGGLWEALINYTFAPKQNYYKHEMNIFFSKNS